MLKKHQKVTTEINAKNCQEIWKESMLKKQQLTREESTQQTSQALCKMGASNIAENQASKHENRNQKKSQEKLRKVCK